MYLIVSDVVPISDIKSTFICIYLESNIERFQGGIVQQGMIDLRFIESYLSMCDK